MGWHGLVDRAWQELRPTLAYGECIEPDRSEAVMRTNELELELDLVSGCRAAVGAG